MSAVTSAEFNLGRTVIFPPCRICVCGRHIAETRTAIAETAVQVGPFQLDVGVSLDGTVHLPSTLSDKELADSIRKVVRRQVLDELTRKWGVA